MDEKDRVFASFKDAQPEPAERRERLTILRPARASGSRVIEVVRVRGTAASAERSPRIDTRVRAASWDDGFPAKRPISTFSSTDLSTAPVAAPVRHVLPAWRPTPTPATSVVDVAPAQAEGPAMVQRRGPGRPRKVNPAWEPAPMPPPADLVPAPTAEPPLAPRRARGRPRKETLSAWARDIADPFDAEDERANCMRCGYAIDPGRESHGLMTCAPCG